MISMQINTKKIEENINILNTYINNYDEIELNLYNNIKNLSIDWNDAYTSSFLNEIKKEKFLIDKLISNLKKYKKIYNYLLENYKKYGSKIKINLDSETKITEQLDEYSNNSDKVLNKYLTQDISFCDTELIDIEYELKKLEEHKKNANELAKKIKKIYKISKNTEENITNMLSKIEVPVIIEKDYYNLDREDILEDQGVNDIIDKTIDKIKLYIDEEITKIESIISIFKELKPLYKSVNDKKIEEIQNDFEIEMKQINHNHENVVEFITDRKNKFKEVQLQVEISLKSKGIS